MAKAKKTKKAKSAKHGKGAKGLCKCGSGLMFDECCGKM